MSNSRNFETQILVGRRKRLLALTLSLKSISNRRCLCTIRSRRLQTTSIKDEWAHGRRVKTLWYFESVVDGRQMARGGEHYGNVENNRQDSREMCEYVSIEGKALRGDKLSMWLNRGNMARKEQLQGLTINNDSRISEKGGWDFHSHSRHFRKGNYSS